jgi:hypothetical protein
MEPVAENKVILLLGDPFDSVLLGVRDQFTGKGMTVHVLSNLFPVNLSLPLGTNPVEAKIIVNGTPVPIKDTSGIVVSKILLGLKSGAMEASDAQYAEYEVYSAWLALLTMAPCTVMNRPGGRIPALTCNSTQIRSFARSLGIPTAKEEICNRSQLVRRKRRGENVSCIDLWSQRAFYLNDDYPIESGRLYSVVEVPTTARYAITIRVADEFSTFIYEAGKGMFPTYDSLQEQLSSYSRTLLDALSLSYAYCSYSLQRDIPEFTRIFTWAPAFLSSETSKIISEKLVIKLAG